MKALLDLPEPSHTLESIRNFSDKSEVYIRGLESLGQCQDTYGSLLIPVMLGKRPIAVKTNIIRENGTDDCTIGNLRKAIQRGILIQKSSTNGSEAYNIPSASFYAGICNPSPTASRITQDLFVDNVLTSFTAEDDLMQFYRDSRFLLQKGGFNL
ncbi:Hypothetical predicted protein [Mytilus galloprovincialis]|uniref:Uncharacterized protein n=1 Tax=Mytilus galloprovincialis TaxID=29158 RepID=A0A8B6FAG8_MYTGA|nr:Hypothetical predicted protein [Mytilus galloprovincialis]